MATTATQQLAEAGDNRGVRTVFFRFTTPRASGFVPSCVCVLSLTLSFFWGTAGAATADTRSSEGTSAPIVVEGDILRRAPSASIGSEFAARARGQYGVSVWPHGLIAYQIDSQISADVRIRIDAAITHWNQYSSVRFVPLQQAPRVASYDYVQFVTHASSCSSYVGRQGGAQELWVSPRCPVGSIIHELGHVVGLEHEHNRFDRDQHVTVLWQHIKAGREVNFNRVSDATTLIGEYDYDSIMHYGAYAFTDNGQPTLMPIDREINTIGQRKALSDGDLNKVNTLYATDLGLVANYVEEDETRHYELIVSNLSDQGAHSIDLVFGAAGANLVDAGEWNCRPLGEEILCSLALLGGGTRSGVLIDSPTRVVPEIGVSTHSYDRNNANNGVYTLAAATASREIASAPVIADTTPVASGGGGVISQLSLLMAALLSLMKLASAQVQRRFLPLSANPMS